MSTTPVPRRRKIAAALSYDGQDERVPRISSVQTGRGADRLLALAREHHVPVHADPELARLLSQLEVGEAIPEELYLLVAEVLLFLQDLDQRFLVTHAPTPGETAHHAYEPLFPPGFFDAVDALPLPPAAPTQDTSPHR